jgi:protein SCO1
MSSKFKILAIFFTVLTLGFMAILAFTNGGEMLKKRYKTISTVEPFRFINQDGQVITEAAIDGKVAVVEFFFTTCKTICPPMNTTMKAIYEMYKNEPDFLILSHTSDPRNDSVPRMKRYADSIGANSKNWLFLTGRKDSLYYAARKSYSLDDQNAVVADPEMDFIHTQLFALVNRKGEIKKKVYDSSIPAEVEELKAEIRKALDE